MKKSRFLYAHPDANPGKIASLEALQDVYADYLKVCVDAPDEPREDDSPEFFGDVLPSLVPVGCDVYPSGRACQAYRWLRILHTGDGPEHADERWVGRRSYDFDQLVDDAGWSTILEPPWSCTEFAYDWRVWLLERGLAPGQAFLVRLGYSCVRDDWGEWDDEWDVEVVAQEPVTNAFAIEAWTKDLAASNDSA